VNAEDIGGALANQGIAATTSVDRTDAAFGVNAGYRFNTFLGVEAAYERLGRFDYSADTGTCTISGKFRANALSLSALGFYPLAPQWSLYGKAGVARTDAKLDAASQNGMTAYFAKAGWDH
jgi:OmpA-OmpF porin, OOP family